MYGKKGYLRTVEAVIAIVIILMFIFVVTPRHIPETRRVPIIVQTAQDHIRVELMNNEDLRNDIISKNYSGLDSLIEETLPTAVFDYDYKVCEKTVCILEDIIEIETSIYTTDVFLIMGDEEGTGSIIVRIWIWQKT